MAWSTNQLNSVTALFQAAKAYGMCLITGKNLMDRNAPASLLDEEDKGERASRWLIEEWNGVGRLYYAVTPRFAPSSTREQLEMAGRLLKEYPGVYMQTHLSENRDELRWVQELFPACKDYLEIYEQAGLLTDRSFFGHGIHLSADERRRISRAGATVVHCPSSNLFLGSGLFDWEGFDRVALGTDVGAGTSLSMLTTMGEAYKGSQLLGRAKDPLELLWSCTMGAAEALGLSDEIGRFKAGSYADFVVVDYMPDELAAGRIDALSAGGQQMLENILFGMQILSADCRISETYVKGEKVYASGWDF
jgi:guanine deaminase